MSRHPRAAAAVLSLLAAVALTGCDSSGSDTSPTSAAPTSGAVSPSQPTAEPTQPTAAPTQDPSQAPTAPGASAPPLGPDVHCMNPQACYWMNPKKLTDDQIEAYLKTVPGGTAAPAEAMKPWEFVVLKNGDTKLSAVGEPKASAAALDDPIGVLNHRVLFVYCRRAEGGAITADTPRDKVWYRIEPITSGPATQWMNGKYLYPYQQNGAVPICG